MMARRLNATFSALLAAAGATHAQTFSLEGAVVDSRTGQSLGVVSERGDLNSLFRAQKALTFGILRAAGISLDQLPVDIRSRIERFQTTNIDAFRAFAQGLDLKDQGKFVEAREFFRRAAELDPSFALAVEQQQAMPDVNLTSGLQTRAVIAAAAGNAVERGKTVVAVDASRAVAALAAGATVVALPSADVRRDISSIDYTINPAGSGGQFQPNLVIGLAYGDSSSGLPLNLVITNEYRGERYRINDNVPQAVGIDRDFFAQRANARVDLQGSTPLGDGSSAYWGRWISSSPNASASIRVGQPDAIVAPQLGAVDYLMAEATRQMPTSSTVIFSPFASGTGGGMVSNPSGTIAVNFANRDVALQNLGFTIGNQVFSGLTGGATYSSSIASGAFSGNYANTGACAGCADFRPTASAFTGNFVGRDANGLVFSTLLITGTAPTATASGLQLFKRP